MEEAKRKNTYWENAQDKALRAAEAELRQKPAVHRELNLLFQLYQTDYDRYVSASDIYADLLWQNNLDEEHDDLRERKKFHQKAYLGLSADVETLTKPNSSPQVPLVPARKLPTPQLPKFDGDVREWISFWAQFKRYHEDPQVIIMDKYQLLIQSMVKGSKAEKVLNRYPVSEENYPKVIEELTTAFGKKSLLIKVYVRELLNLVVANSSGRKSNFDEVASKINSQIRNLETLGVTREEYGQILYPVVESCLPEQLYEAWQRLECDEELDLLLDFLQKEVSRRAERDLARNQFGNAPQTTPVDKNGKGNKANFSKSPSSSPTASFASTSGGKFCVFCEKDHHSHECGKAVYLSFNQKKEILKKKKSCLRCFRHGHGPKDCRSTVVCEMCGNKHYKIMCLLLEEKSTAPTPSSSKSSAFARKKREEEKKKTVSFTDESEEEDQPKATTADMNTTSSSCEVPLQTLHTYAFGKNGKTKRVRVMFDSGAQKSYIRSSLAIELELKKTGSEQVVHQLFGGTQSQPQQHEIRKLYLGNKDGSSNGNFEVRCTDVISHHIISPFGGPWIKKFAQRGVIFSDFGNENTGVDILVGNDVRPHCFTGKKVKLHEGPGPVAEETIWGWVLSGKLPSATDNNNQTMMVTNLHIADLPITDLWSLETIGIRDSAAKESREQMDREVILHFKETVKQLEDGRYEVGLPWLQGMKGRLPNNYFACLQRLKSTTTQLKKNGYLEKYQEVFNQWLKDGMIEEIDEKGTPETHQAQYLPHRAVIKESSSTTPVRPVFDASAKLKGHPSLNECVDKGANTLELIPSIITRFRVNIVGVIADIKKAFQQISVIPEDREYLRFLWWEDSSCKKVKLYRHTRVVFGVSASPFLLGITLRYLIEKYQLQMPRDTEIIAVISKLLHDMYVDNLVTSFRSIRQARNFQIQATQILLPAQFDLRGWIFGPNGKDEEISVLGLLWNTMTDTLAIDISAALEKLEEENMTQRSLLSLAHCLFDPLGLISPFVLLAKIMLRECHQLKLGWDTNLPTQLQKEVRRWGAEIIYLREIRVPRYSFIGEKKGIVSYHVFCDASGSAYATAVFVRVEIDGRVEVSLIQSRSRVAPKKQCTIPRLELISCTTGARLYTSVMEDVKGQNHPVIFWTDSTTALAWITGGGPWGVFVNNRKAEINALTEINSWRHIPGKCNPADLPSRGCSANKLVESRWWEGPTWLRDPPSEWPTSKEKADPIVVEAELRKTVVTCVATESQHSFLGLLRVSNYQKIIQILANVVKFKQALFGRLNYRETINNPDEGSDIIDSNTEAEHLLIRFIQQQLHQQPQNLKRLRPYEDKYGVIRTKTRLTHDDDENFKSPIILPNKNEFVARLIRWEHDNNCHIGTEMLLAKLRERYWIIQGRKFIRKIIDSCWICKRYLTRPLQVPEASLPSVRTGLSYPFATIGVDATGPLVLKDQTKVWVILYTCAVYRAVHLEVVEAMTTGAFLLSFRHFIAKRARPQVVYSDNGLNFVGAQRALVEVDWGKVLEYAQEKRIQWRFNTPTAAWHGGFFERMIGVVKGLLRRMLGKRVVHFHELLTMCLEVEEAVNNRPLTHISEDPDDPQPLTPNHFVKNLDIPASFPEGDVIAGHDLRVKFKKLQHLREALRSRFRQEYIGSLLHNRQVGKVNNLQPKDIVLVKRKNFKRQNWELAKIISPVISKKDGIARSYIIRVNGVLNKRPAQHLCPMELSGEDAAYMRDQDRKDSSMISA